MPSSHSALAVSYLVFRLLDSMFRISADHQETWLDAVRGAPLVSDGVYSPKAFSLHATFWCIVLLPVPLSRVILRDHSPEQVIAGSFLGLIEALCWMTLIQFLR